MSPRRCKAEYYSVGNKTACTLCEAGHECRSGLKKVCESGTYSDAGAVQCSPCPGGKYCNGTGLTSSTLNNCPRASWCPYGGWDDNLKVSCYLGLCSCKKGFYGTTTGAKTQEQGCQLCPEGTYCDENGMTTPKTCPKGYYCKVGTVSGWQYPCPAGTVGLSSGATLLSQCVTCPAGRFCDSGYSGGDTYNMCPPGHYCPSGTIHAFQFPCPGGTYSEHEMNTASVNCTSCPIGHYCPQASTGPIKCPAGTYGPNAGTESITSCIECPAGYYCPEQGLTNLTKIKESYICPEGNFCPERTIYPRSNPCPPGTYGETTGLYHVDQCKMCPEGWWCDWRTTNSSVKPKKRCNTGHYCPWGSTSPALYPCPPGQYYPWNNGTKAEDCMDCPAGSYCVGGKDHISGACAPGYHCPQNSNTSKMIACPEGTYSPHPGQTNGTTCITCPIGHYCLKGYAHPKLCPAGTYNNLTGATGPGHRYNSSMYPSCVSCPAGYYCSGAWNVTDQPVPCVKGFYSKIGDESCRVCKAGYYCDMDFMNETQMLGKVCPAGSFCPKGLTAPPTDICPTGHYCPAGSTFATPCPPGTFQKYSNQSNCTICPDGYYCVEQSTNFTGPCSPGFYCPKGSDGSRAKPCPAGTYNNFTGRWMESQCTDCPEKSYCPEGTTFPVLCPAGSFCPNNTGWPVPCPKGTYSNATGLSNAANCTLCDGGRFCDTLGLKEVSGLCSPGHFCTKGAKQANPADSGVTGGICPKGHYCTAGLEVAIPCPPGTYNNKNGSKTLTACLPCPPGYYCGNYGQTKFETCCEQGWFCTGGAHHARQHHCPPGSYCGTCAEDPTPCPLGYYNPHNNRSSCLPCEAGSYCPEMNMSSLTGFECPAGSYCAEGVKINELCPAGTYSNVTSRNSSAACTPCPPGYYCETNGLKQPSGKCTAGYICHIGSSDPTPEAIQGFGEQCPAGHYCEEGATKGIPCPMGTFRPVTLGRSAGDCLACPPGKVCNKTGLTSFSGYCGAGYYCGGNASSPQPVESDTNGICTLGHYCPPDTAAPLKCPAGTYAPTQGLGACLTCPKGSYCGLETITPNACPRGFYCNNGTSYMYETPCPKGSFGNITGMDGIEKCYQCTGGKYCDTLGAQQPTGECQQGYYCPPGSQDKYGKTANAVNHICPAGSFCPSGSAQPTHCPPGKWSNSSMDVDGSKCRSCTKGHYCGSSGLGAPTGKCSAGYYCTGNSTTPTPSGGVGGDICQAGNYCPEGSWEMIPCDSGNYTNVTGSSACSICPPGFFCPQSASQPHECPKGHYCPIGTRVYNENPCGPGKFNPVLGRDGPEDCIDCPAGMYCETPGLGNATGPCEAGYYCTGGSAFKNPNATVGGQCTPGNYCPPGSPAQVPCLGGAFCQDFRLGAPSGKCYEGYYCDQGAVTPTHLECTTGHFCPNATKDPVPCPPGSYSPSMGAKDLGTCKPCPSGYYCNRSGVASVSSSILCTEGYYCLNGTVTPTLECPRGHKCPLGTGWPVPCPAGTYQDELKKGTCKSATAGFYAEGAGNENMTVCAPGYYCLENTTFRTQYPCPKGTFSDKYQLPREADCMNCTGGSYCASNGLTEPTGICQKGYYCLGGSSSATPTDAVTGNVCPEGFFCPANSSLPTACGKGLFSSGKGNTAQSDCLDCPRGQYCAEAAASALNSNNSGLCSPGYICFSRAETPTPVDGTTGRQCHPGKYCPEGTTVELNCGVGTWNANPGRGVCDACTAGYYCDETNMTSVVEKPCPVGYYCAAGSVHPDPCPKGTWSNELRRPGVNNCTLCPAGKYCNQLNLTEPGNGDCFGGYFCGQGSSSPTPNGTVVKGVGGGWTGYGDCPAGHYCPNGTQAPVPCSPGKYNPHKGALAEISCVSCPEGSFCETPGLGAPTNNCTAGYYCPQGSITGNSSANLCPSGYSCPPGSSMAIKCSGGTYSDLPGLAECKYCPARFYCPDNSNQTIECPVGSYCPNGTEYHILCPNGTYGAMAGLGNVAQCQACPAGQYCTDGQISGNCSAGYICTIKNYEATPNVPGRGTPCPKGHYCPRGIPAAVPCPDDTYRNATYGERVDDCTDCPAGFQCDAGSVLPVPCPAGKYCPFKTRPILCPARTYRTATGGKNLSDCDTCPKGYLCNVEGISSLSPHLCPVKAYCTKGVNQSIPCTAGTFQDITGAGSRTECRSCPGGFYCPDATDVPLACWAGTYCPKNSSQPTNCPGGSYCPPRSEVANLCPPGWYCPANSTKPIYCDGPNYCPLGSVFPIPCGNGTRSLDVVNRTSFVTTCADCLPGKWQVNSSEKTCMDCDAGYVCTGGASDPSPLYDFQGGMICPKGYYCPKATTMALPCPEGTYSNSTGAVDATTCELCPKNTYNNKKGQSGCFSCSSTSESSEGATTCNCIGRNRVFQAFDSSCLCEGGYTYTDTQGDDGSNVDGDQDCELKVYDRCRSGQARKSDGSCKDPTYDCTEAGDCGSAGGTFSPTLGTCQCNDAPDLDTICDATCRASKPVVVLVDHTIYIYNDSSSGVASCVVEMSALSGFVDYSDCAGATCTMLSSEVSGGTISGSYSLTDAFLNKIKQACPITASALAMDEYTRRVQTLDYVAMTLPVNATASFDEWNSVQEFNAGGRQLLDTSSSVTASFSPALHCLIEGEGVIFSVTGTSYPVYLESDLLNEPKNFDHGAFRELKSRLQANATSVSVFAYTFKQAGTYVFADASATTSRSTIYRVLPSTSQCPGEARILPFTIENLNSLGVSKEDDLLLTPDWTMIGIMAGLVLAVLLGLIIGSYVFRNTGWGTANAANARYRTKAKSNSLNLWHFHSKGSVVQQKDTSKGLRDPKELDLTGGVSVPAAGVVQPGKPVINKTVTKDLDVTQPILSTSMEKDPPIAGEKIIQGDASKRSVKSKIDNGEGVEKAHMYEWQNQVSTEDFDFHSLYKQLELSREDFTQQFKSQEEDLRSFYKHMSEETDHLKSVLAVKMNVQLKTSGEGFGEAVRRLVLAEISARKSFQWRLEDMRLRLWQICTSDMPNAINTIRNEDYTITEVRNQCRILQQHIMNLFRGIEQERTRRRGFGAHVEVVGVPIIKALSDLDFMEKKVQDALVVKLNAFNFSINEVLKRIAKLDEKFAAIKKAAANTPGGDDKLKREQQKQHLRMIKKAKVIGEKCLKLRGDLSKLKSTLDDAAQNASDQHDHVANELLNKREEEVAAKSTNLFRGINPDMAKVLSGLLGMKGGFVFDEKSQTLLRAEPFDPTDPFAGIVDSSLDSEAKVLRGNLEKLKLQSKMKDEENDAAIKALKDKIEELKKEHEAKKKELEERLRKEAEEKAKLEVAGEIAGAVEEKKTEEEKKDLEELKKAEEELKKVEDESKNGLVDITDALEDAEDDEEAKAAAERLKRIKELQDKVDRQRQKRLEMERKHAEELRLEQERMHQDELEFQKLISSSGVSDDNSIGILKESEVQLAMEVGEGDGAAEQRKKRLQELARKRKAAREKRLAEMKADMESKRNNAKDKEKDTASELVKEQVLNSIQTGDGNVSNNIDADKLKAEYEEKMRKLLEGKDAEEQRLKQRLIDEAKSRMNEEATINGLISMADKERSKRLTELQSSKKKQMDIMKARMRKRMAAAKARAEAEKKKLQDEGKDANDEEVKKIEQGVLKEQVSLLQEQLEQEKKLSEKVKDQMEGFEQELEQKIENTVDGATKAMQQEAEAEKKISDAIERQVQKKLAMHRKNLEGASDPEERLRMQEEYDAMVEKLKAKAAKEQERLLNELRKKNDAKVDKDVADLLKKSRAERDNAAMKLKADSDLARQKLRDKLRRRREKLRRKFESSDKNDVQKLEFIEEMNKIQDEESKSEAKLRNEEAEKILNLSKEEAQNMKLKKDEAKAQIDEWNEKQKKNLTDSNDDIVEKKVDENADVDDLQKRIRELEEEAKRREAKEKEVSDSEKAKSQINNLLDSFTTSRASEEKKLQDERKAAQDRMKARRKRMLARRRKKKNSGDQTVNKDGISTEEIQQIEDALSHFTDEETKKEHAKDVIEAVFKNRFKEQRKDVVKKAQADLAKLQEDGDVPLAEMMKKQQQSYREMKQKQNDQVKKTFKKFFPNETCDGVEWEDAELKNDAAQKMMDSAAEQANKHAEEMKKLKAEKEAQIERIRQRERERAEKRIKMALGKDHKTVTEEKEKYLKNMGDGKKASDMILKQYRDDEKMLHEAILVEQERQLDMLEKELENRKKKRKNKKRLANHMQFLSKSSQQDSVVRNAAQSWAGRGVGFSEEDAVVLTEYSMEQFQQEFGQTVKPHELEIFKKLKNIEDLMKAYRKTTKDWQRSNFVDEKDRVYQSSSELTEPVICELEELTNHEIILHRFGLSLIKVLYKHGLNFVKELKTDEKDDKGLPIPTPPLVLLASELPVNPFQTAYKNSFWYHHSTSPVPDHPDEGEDHNLFIRRDRLKNVGEFILVLVHTTAHILSKQWEDRHPRFLQLFHKLLQFCCADLFITRSSDEPRTQDSEIEEVVALKMELQGGEVGDHMSHHQLQQRMKKYMLYTHSKAIQTHLDNISRHTNLLQPGEEKTQKHNTTEVGSKLQQLEDLADEYDSKMCNVVMQMFQISGEIKKREAGIGSSTAGELSIEQLEAQYEQLENEKNDLATKVERVNRDLRKARG